MTLRFKSHFKIGAHKIGVGNPVFFIAEGGVAHFGDIKKLEALINMSADAGADAFKLQAYRTEQMISSSLPDWQDRMRTKEVDYDFLKFAKEKCDEKGLMFLCTAHDEEALEWLVDMDLPAYKIGSGERGNIPFIRKIASHKKPVILSTGMYEVSDIQEMLQAVFDEENDELALLHCVTSYPTPDEQVNLRAIDVLRDLTTAPVGYSDHTKGHLAVLGAVALGACVIEKHITLEFNIPNAQDWKVSAGPDDLSNLLQSIRQLECQLGRYEKVLQECEKPSTEWALKRIVAKSNLEQGMILTPDLLTEKRAQFGILPSEYDKVIGRTITKSIASDAPVTWEDIS